MLGCGSLFSAALWCLLGGVVVFLAVVTVVLFVAWWVVSGGLMRRFRVRWGAYCWFGMFRGGLGCFEKFRGVLELLGCFPVCSGL